MLREIRRKGRALDEAGAWGILERADWGTLCLALRDGQPYGVPLNHVCLDGRLYFHCAKQGLKLELLRQNPHAHFSAVSNAGVEPQAFSTRYQSAMARGAIGPVDDPHERLRALTALCARHAPGLEQQAQEQIQRFGAATVVLRMDVTHISAKSRE